MLQHGSIWSIMFQNGPILPMMVNVGHTMVWNGVKWSEMVRKCVNWQKFEIDKNWPKLTQTCWKYFSILRTCEDHLNTQSEDAWLIYSWFLAAQLIWWNISISHLCFVISWSLYFSHLRTCNQDMHTKKEVTSMDNGQLVRGTVPPYFGAKFVN